LAATSLYAAGVYLKKWHLRFRAPGYKPAVN